MLIIVKFLFFGGNVLEKCDIAYFAAANSYQGFISYFNRVFESEKFDKVFILKGGPGTGKSSLMRTLCNKLKPDRYKTELIFCSSDPKSLDGIISSNDKGRIAILDGTAPHVRDAELPGVIDEIVNLGDNWDERWLISKRQDILNLSSEKKNAYKTAYNYLHLAGECDAVVNSIKKANFDAIATKNLAESILLDYLAPDEESNSSMMISSFNRLGDYNLSIPQSLYDKTFNVADKSGLSLIYVAELLREKHVGITLFPTAKDDRRIDAILLKKAKILIKIGDKPDLDATQFLSLSDIDSERIRVCREMQREFLSEAKRWFNIASDIHFELEKIYSMAMDFEKNDDLCEKIYQKITNIGKKR